MRNRYVYSLTTIVIIFLTLIPTLAQEDDTQSPTPTQQGPDFVYSWQAEVFYPEIVRFDVVVDRQLSYITSITLSILPAGQNAITLAFNPQDIAIFTDQYTELTYVWEIPDEIIFSLGEIISYSWLITTRQDGANGFSGSFLFADPRGEWTYYFDPEEQVNLLLPDNPRLQVENIWASIRDIYQLFATSTNQELTFNFVFSSEDLPLNPCQVNEDGVPEIIETRTEQTFICEDSTIQNIFEAGDFTIVPIETYNLRQIQSVLTDRFFEGFYSDLLTNNNVPMWFVEGLHEFYLPQTKLTLLDVLQTAGRNDQIFNLSELQQFNPLSNSPDTLLRSAQSYGMVLYIANQVGFDNLLELAQRLNTATPENNFETEYEAITGQSLSGLLINFNNWLYTDVAQSNFDLIILQEPTSLPSNTPTNTPFPPTATYTPTATATATATATVTGVLSATSLPTLTATSTRRPQEPTNTPRPAGSLLSTPTEQPSTTNTSTDSQLPLLGISLIVFGVIVLAIVITLMLRNNRKQ